MVAETTPGHPTNPAVGVYRIFGNDKSILQQPAVHPPMFMSGPYGVHSAGVLALRTMTDYQQQGCGPPPPNTCIPCNFLLITHGNLEMESVADNVYAWHADPAPIMKRCPGWSGVLDPDAGCAGFPSHPTMFLPAPSIDRLPTAGLPSTIIKKLQQKLQK